MANRKRRKKLRRRQDRRGSIERQRANGISPRTDGQAPSRPDWEGSSGSIGTYITEESKKTLEAYRSQPNLVDEHANHEEDTARGGYARRQLFELVQNGADALAGSRGGRIELRLGPRYLYCADEGRAIDPDGVTALMFSHLSPKRGTTEIGRFGLGFKSVLGVTDAPEFFSRSGSFRFDRERAAGLIRRIAPGAKRYPVLRLPEAIDPWSAMEADPILHKLMGWAVNIVRLPLKPGAREVILRQFEEFPPEFLLFVGHVSQLVLQSEDGAVRKIRLHREGGSLVLDDSGSKSHWRLESKVHRLSADARSDSRSLDDATEVPISWAAPIDRLNEPGLFWAFFPTITSSLLAGILNAPWKTNEDRQNLLPGVYNDELIDAAAAMVARALPRLSNSQDPACHLDALPRRYEAGDAEHSNRLRNQLHSNLRDSEVVPDQSGKLRRPAELSYAPGELTDPRQGAARALARWAAYDGRPLSWAHHRVLTRNRLAALRELLPNRGIRGPQGQAQVPTATIAEWLEALVDNAETLEEAVEASKAAIQIAALMPETVRQGENLGQIVLTSYQNWVAPDPSAVFLGEGRSFDATALVHPQLEADAETLTALKELGINPASAESASRSVAGKVLEDGQYRSRPPTDRIWSGFWRLTHDVEQKDAAQIIQSHRGWRSALRVRTIGENWVSLHHALLPGPIVPADGTRDTDVAIDTRYHEADLPLLRRLGAVDTPRGGCQLSPAHLRRFREQCRDRFTRRDLPSNPRPDYLDFEDPATTSGPLDVLEALSDEGSAAFTWQLMGLPSTYWEWTMRHDTRGDYYPSLSVESPALEVLRFHGRVVTDDGIRPLSDGLGESPQDPAVLHKLLAHPQAHLIRQAFGLPDDEDIPVEPLGEDAPMPLLDVWPGLKSHLSGRQNRLDLVRCDGFRTFDGEEPSCVVADDVVYVARHDDEGQELRSVLFELGALLSDDRIDWILLGHTPEDVQEARNAVRSCASDEERLLAAVGESALRRRLPNSLLAILEDTQPLSGVDLAQAAIATYHSGALQEYRLALDHLDPPRQWAGRSNAVQFARSLGFSEEWAGDSNTRREPFLEVDGPFSLPELHDYQRTVVDNVRSLIRANGARGERSGMISMPTGSGKTRVTVQAIVEAMREDGFRGGILWVADRDELCEQAVEAWREVWASEGAQKTRLRISRMWRGQPQPLRTADMHVIVATIQTLYAKTTRQPDAYDFLADFKLLVFDEAHRSVAPTFTSVMQDLGLTRLRRAHEPLLLGLTATPYRGRDERQTERLVRRYGNNRLDNGAFASADPEHVIEELQAMRVLARAEHEIIEGARLSMSAEEVRQSRDTPWLPRSVEHRIAGDAERTVRIIQAYFEHIDPKWPALVFATSVEHSKTVAALLNQHGIKARAVSADTSQSVRRRVVEEFRAGEINALVNYGIFREGFDAPKTRAIVVARPVYSPNLYFQMIGRGLRGIKNGGNDRCLVLNVRDNIENFERKLAFSELDWLWA